MRNLGKVHNNGNSNLLEISVRESFFSFFFSYNLLNDREFDSLSLSRLSDICSG